MNLKPNTAAKGAPLKIQELVSLADKKGYFTEPYYNGENAIYLHRDGSFVSFESNDAITEKDLTYIPIEDFERELRN